MSARENASVHRRKIEEEGVGRSPDKEKARFKQKQRDWKDIEDYVRGFLFPSIPAEDLAYAKRECLRREWSAGKDKLLIRAVIHMADYRVRGFNNDSHFREPVDCSNVREMQNALQNDTVPRYVPDPRADLEHLSKLRAYLWMWKQPSDKEMAATAVKREAMTAKQRELDEKTDLQLLQEEFIGICDLGQLFSWEWREDDPNTPICTESIAEWLEDTSS